MSFLLVAPREDVPSGGHLYNRRIGELTRCRVATHDEADPRDGEPVVVDSLYLHAAPPAARFLWLLHWLPDEVGGPSVQAALARAAGFIVTSEFMAERLRARGFSRVSVCEPGLEDRYFERAPRSATGHHVLTVANFEARKGHLALLEALRGLPLPWTWELIGDTTRDPELTRRFEARVRELGLSGRVQVRGSRSPDEVFDAYGRADLFAMFPSYEPYGMVFAEAVASGVPVVAPRVGEIARIVGAAGVLFDAPAEAGAALARAFAHREALSAHGRSARQRFPRWKDTAEAFVATVLRWTAREDERGE